MLVKVACLCYSGSMDFFQIVFHFKLKLVGKATEQISSKTKLATSVGSPFSKEKHKEIVEKIHSIHHYFQGEKQ